MSSLTDLGPIPPVVLAIAHYGSPEMVLFIRAHGEAAFFLSMILGQIKTIRARRADGTFYPALLTDLRWYWHQFRGWNRIVVQMRHAIGQLESNPSSANRTICHPDPLATTDVRHERRTA